MPPRAGCHARQGVIRRGEHHVVDGGHDALWKYGRKSQRLRHLDQSQVDLAGKRYDAASHDLAFLDDDDARAIRHRMACSQHVTYIVDEEGGPGLLARNRHRTRRTSQALSLLSR
jgi:hypothetical protein